MSSVTCCTENLAYILAEAFIVYLTDKETICEKPTDC